MSSQIQDFKLPNDWQNSNPQTFENLANVISATSSHQFENWTIRKRGILDLN